MRFSTIVFAAAALALLPPSAAAQNASPPLPEPRIRVSGYLQPQYERADVGEDEARDRAFFRRLVVTFSARANERWIAQLQADLAPVIDGDRLQVKDAYLRYAGWQNRGLTLTIGNQKLPFSRSVLAPSSRRSLIERPIEAERAFGSPGRALAIKLDGDHHGHHLQWSGAFASALHSPDPRQVRIDGIADARADWSEGWLAAGRLEFHPFGNTPREQGNFGERSWRTVFAAAGYLWTNDGDRNLPTVNDRATSALTADVDDAAALELSAGIRGHRTSIDIEYHHVASHTIDRSFDGGLYRAGRAALHGFGLEAGYMIVPRRLEALGGLEALDAHARDAVLWRQSLGLVWYLAAHDVKVSVMHRETENDSDEHGRATFVQAQIAF